MSGSGRAIDGGVNANDGGVNANDGGVNANDGGVQWRCNTECETAIESLLRATRSSSGRSWAETDPDAAPCAPATRSMVYLDGICGVSLGTAGADAAEEAGEFKKAPSRRPPGTRSVSAMLGEGANLREEGRGARCWGAEGSGMDAGIGIEWSGDEGREVGVKVAAHAWPRHAGLGHDGGESPASPVPPGGEDRGGDRRGEKSPVRPASSSPYQRSKARLREREREKELALEQRRAQRERWSGGLETYKIDFLGWSLGVRGQQRDLERAETSAGAWSPSAGAVAPGGESCNVTPSTHTHPSAAASPLPATSPGRPPLCPTARAPPRKTGQRGSPSLAPLLVPAEPAPVSAAGGGEVAVEEGLGGRGWLEGDVDKEPDREDLVCTRGSPICFRGPPDAADEAGSRASGGIPLFVGTAGAAGEGAAGASAAGAGAGIAAAAAAAGKGGKSAGVWGEDDISAASTPSTSLEARLAARSGSVPALAVDVGSDWDGQDGVGAGSQAEWLKSLFLINS